MTTYKPIFTRPIEIQDDTDYYRVTYDIDGVGSTNKDIDPGTYANCAALLEALETAANAGGGVGKTIEWYFAESNGVILATCNNATDSTGMKVKLGVNSTAELAKILGDVGQDMNDAPYASTRTAQMQPEFTWIPTYQNASQDYFGPRLDQHMAGHVMKSGRYVGNKTASNPIQYKTLRFTNELKRNIFDEGATTLVSAYDIYGLRNLYKFTECMTWNNQDSGNPDARGFFYYPDWNKLIDYPEIVPGGTDGITTTYEGINFDHDSNSFRKASYFAYCQFDNNPFQHPKCNAPSGRENYEVEFTIHTIDGMPSWTAPDQSG